MKPYAWIASLLIIAVATLPVSVVAAATSVVGEVAQLKGKAARFGEDGVASPLKKGDAVFVSDRVETRSRSLITIRFKDDTTFSLGPESAFQIESFKFEKGAKDDIATRVLRGAFRFTTGLIAKARARSMRVQTGAVATIGIRGTTVGGEVIGESASIVLLEPEEPGTAAAIEVSNAYGSVVIDKPGYGTTVPDARSPPTPPQRMRLRTIDNLIRSIQTIQRISVPRPSY